MRKISYMYQQSGGCNHRHFCRECVCMQKASDGVKNGFRAGIPDYCCMKHPDGHEWNPAWLSCKYFSDEQPAKSKKPATTSKHGKMTKKVHQMTIMELLGAEA